MSTTSKEYMPASQSGFLAGAHVQARFGGGDEWYDGTVAAANGNGMYNILYDDGDSEDNVAEEFIRRVVAVTPGAAASAPASASSGGDGGFVVGAKVECQYDGGDVKYPGIIAAVNANGTFDVAYDDGDGEAGVITEFITLVGSSSGGSGASRSFKDAPPTPPSNPLEAENAALRAENTTLRALVAKLRSRIAELEAQWKPAAAGEQKKHAAKAQLPPLLQGYTEPKLNLAEAEAPVLALQEKLLQASTEPEVTVARTELAKAQAVLQQDVVRELWTQLGGLECRTKTARLTFLAEVMGASNSRFHGVYSQIVKGVKSDDREAFAAFVDEAAAIRQTCTAEKRVCRQGTEDAIEILLQAKRAGPGFEKLLAAVATSVEGASHTVGPLKKLYRMVEKTALRAENCGGLSEDGVTLEVAFSFARVCDVRRGFIQCNSFAQLRAVLAALRQQEKDGIIVIRRIKDRFSTPSVGGWADCMVNFSLTADPDGHVCELQCVHAQLMLARKELGGHQIYGKGRAAAELLELAGVVVPEAWHIRIALLCFWEFAKMHGLELQDDDDADSDDDEEWEDWEEWKEKGGKAAKVKGWEGWGSNKEVTEWNGVLKQAPVATPLVMVRVRQADVMADMMAATLAFVPPRSRKLQSINLEKCRKVTNVGVGELAKHCPQLQSINLKECCKITDVGVKELAKHCPQLQRINLDWCDKVTDMGMRELAKHCPQLHPDKVTSPGPCEKKGDLFLAEVAKHWPQLQSIDLEGSGNVTDVGVGELAKHCPQLQSINLSQCYVTDVGVGELAKYCPQLQSINLKECPDEVTDVGVGALAKGCPKLQSINLACCDTVTDVGVGELAKHSPQLQNINLYFCDKITDVGLGELAKHCAQLQNINLANCDKITDVGLGELAKHSAQLQEIDLTECREVTDMGVGELAKHCAQLRSINLWGCNTVTDAGLGELAKGCPQLQSINLEKCIAVSDVGIEALAKHCAQLQEMDLTDCKEVTDAGLGELVKHCPQLHPDKIESGAKGNLFLAAVAKHCAQLQSVDLASCKKITDAGLGELAKGCAQLQSINLGWCEEVTDAGLGELAKHCPQLHPDKVACKIVPAEDAAVAAGLRRPYGAKGDVFLAEVVKHWPQLQSINLLRCFKVTDAGLGGLAKHCPQLQSINLSECEKVTDVGVGVLAKHCPQLQSINLKDCDKVTDVGVIELAKHCPQLQRINLENCDTVTDVGIEALAKHCPRLQRINLSGMGDGVTEQCVEELPKRYPNLHFPNYLEDEEEEE